MTKEEEQEQQRLHLRSNAPSLLGRRMNEQDASSTARQTNKMPTGTTRHPRLTDFSLAYWCLLFVLIRQGLGGEREHVFMIIDSSSRNNRQCHGHWPFSPTVNK